MTCIAGWDVATRITGYCIGPGDKIPRADAFCMEQYGDDIPAMLDDFDRYVIKICDRFSPTHFVNEGPILKPTDKLLTVRKLYALHGQLGLRARRRGIIYKEQSAQALKRELAGKRDASKADMVYVAKKVGIRLPATHAAGEEDAADAFAAWLIGVRLYDKPHSMAWDARIHGSRGALF